MSILLLVTTARSEIYSLTIPPAPSPGPARHMGANNAPPTAPLGGGTIEWNNLSLLHNGQPWLPVMGEFHFSRYPAAEWRDELLKMKAGGISIISTYVFWIHHEEVQGQFDWTGDKNLHAFVQTCAALDLPVIVRIGPWCHGEVRNGGFPDWVQALPGKRTDDPAYLAAVRPYFAQIAAQLKGLLWKDGGPVIGIQIENEFGGNQQHLMTLKKIAVDAGLDTPLYTHTGWPAVRGAQVPFGEMLPLFGDYAEGFWDRELTTMPGNYWRAFTFAAQRTTTAVFQGPQSATTAADTADTPSYPYLTCELGGGMMSSYHRRIVIDPMDTYAIPLIKIGSGSNLPGYYMYHGGTNPDGKLSTLMESQSPPQNMWNDMPVKTYDFQAPLGEFGQVRDSYHLLRRLHLFLHDWGSQLATMPATIAPPPRGKTDASTLRWSVRSDGKSGFLFVNNYQRALDMPAKKDVQFQINFAGGRTVKVPENGGMTVPANASFILPMNMDLDGVNLTYATAQPVCKCDIDGDPVIFFTRISGVTPEFVLDKSVALTNAPQEVSENTSITLDAEGHTRLSLNLNTDAWVRFRGPDGRTRRIIVLSDSSSLGVYKGSIAGKELVVVAPAWDVTFEGPQIRLVSKPGNQNRIRLLPRPGSLQLIGATYDADPGSPIAVLIPHPSQNLQTPATFELLKPAGPPRTIPLGSQRVAAQPTDADFDVAAVYRIHLPLGLTPDRRILLRLHYVGDVARLYLGNKLLDDNFYNGAPFDFALRRLPPNTTELTLKILPLQKSAPIYFTRPPDFGPQSTLCDLKSTELLAEYALTTEAK